MCGCCRWSMSVKWVCLKGPVHCKFWSESRMSHVLSSQLYAVFPWNLHVFAFWFCFGRTKLSLQKCPQLLLYWFIYECMNYCHFLMLIYGPYTLQYKCKTFWAMKTLHSLSNPNHVSPNLSLILVKKQYKGPYRYLRYQDIFACMIA